MMEQTVMLKVETVANAVQLPALTGKSFTVAKTVTAAGNGMSKWLVLVPQGSSAAATDGIVALKVEGGKQMVGNLVGQTFTIGKAPVMAKGAGEWLVLQPKAVAGSAASIKGILGGAGLAGQGAAQVTTFQMVHGVDPNLALALQGLEAEAPDVVAVVAKGAATKGAVAKGAVVVTQGGGVTTGGAAAVGVAGKSAASGTLWSGTGTSLGLGLGLGAWGPVLLVGVLTFVTLGVYNYYKNREVGNV